jgi:hypothetical protein
LAKFHELKEFERLFDKMTVAELKRWKKYSVEHARYLAPKVRKQAMKRVYAIDRAIERRSEE